MGDGPAFAAIIGRGALYRRALSLRAARDGAIGDCLYLDCARKCAGGGLRGVGVERLGDCDHAAFAAILAASRYLGAWRKRLAFARHWPHQPADFTALCARSFDAPAARRMDESPPQTCARGRPGLDPSGGLYRV